MVAVFGLRSFDTPVLEAKLRAPSSRAWIYMVNTSHHAAHMSLADSSMILLVIFLDEFECWDVEARPIRVCGEISRCGQDISLNGNEVIGPESADPCASRSLQLLATVSRNFFHCSVFVLNSPLSTSIARNPHSYTTQTRAPWQYLLSLVPQ